MVVTSQVLSQQPLQANDRTAACQAFYQQIRPQLPAAALNNHPLDLISKSQDASFYQLVPQLIVTIQQLSELQILLKAARQHQVGLTFRGAGTSLSGQTLTDQVLVQLGSGFAQGFVLQDGELLSSGPMLRGGDANTLLRPFGRMIAPVPASLASATIGGICANNASGMNALDTYQVLDSIELVLADGTVLDTADRQSVARFRVSHQQLLLDLQAVATALLADADLSARIRRKFTLKNTTGYGLRALLDFTDPIQMLSHLLIGSEGTLGFIASVRQRTIRLDAHSASAFLLFSSLEQAGFAVQLLAQLGRDVVGACELLDDKALLAVRNQSGLPPVITTLEPGVTALLLQTGAADPARLQLQMKLIVQAVAHLADPRSLPFSTDETLCRQYWNIRKGVFPAVGATRPAGTTALIEDVCYPVSRLTEALQSLRALLDQHGYPDAVIYGHALDGNIHFIFSQGFATESDTQRYQQLIDAVVHQVVDGFDGSLKAEHGTGRNMAPFVRYEWGDKAYAAMRRIKQLLDPHGLLNPGVLLNDDPFLHLRHLKPLPATNPLIDACIECGFCERVCPSRSLTLTPRQRIVANRHLATLNALGEARLSAELLQHHDYQAVQTCAACGLCTTQCPVGINTGDLTRQQRSLASPEGALSQSVARHFAGITKAAALGLTLGHATARLIGAGRLQRLSQRLQPYGMPVWLASMPVSAGALAPDNAVHEADFIYLPACVSRVMGAQHNNPDRRNLTQIVRALADKAGLRFAYPPALTSQCCGLPFQSKGQFRAAAAKSAEVLAALWQQSQQGQRPVLIDTSPCALKLREDAAGHPLYRQLKLTEPATFALQYLVPRLQLSATDNAIALHPTCSSRRMHTDQAQLQLARLLSHSVVVPEDIHCCGFAGDKGFQLPELNAAALAPLRAQVSHCQGGYSTSRTCEIGLSAHSDLLYQSLLQLLDQQSSPG
jgi:D-lactate dehydrogenase